MLKKVKNLKELKLGYTIIEESFPLNEYRSFDNLNLLFIRKKIIPYIYLYKKKVVGIALIWNFSNFIYLENFAISPNLRGLGIGSKILQNLKTIYLKKIFILEVENPQNIIQQKRIKFYERNKFLLSHIIYLQPQLDIQTNFPNSELILMFYPYIPSLQIQKSIINTIHIKVYAKK